MIRPKIPAAEAPSWLAAPVEVAAPEPEEVRLALDPALEEPEAIHTRQLVNSILSR